MTYQETIQYLYATAPMFQQIGGSAYKENLVNTVALDEYLGHPHKQFRCIHIGGTNGKGSCSHTLAAILQSAGYKVGLYTSPHLLDFRERIRVDGEVIPEAYVIEFVEKHKAFFEPLRPSFFEITTALAFDYFASRCIDVAIVEVGLGGRLDCTNIISPDLALITNISLDHTQFLGNTLSEIAKEKAGIIKTNTPVIVGETTPETKSVFIEEARKANAPIYFSEEINPIDNITKEEGRFCYHTQAFGRIVGELRGNYQQKNSRLIFTAIQELIKSGYQISEDAVRTGFAKVCEITGLMGRWQKVNKKPLAICDTGHNIGGIQYIVEQLAEQKYDRLHIVIGMVNDKDVSGVLALLPRDAIYYFTRASVPRALSADELASIASKFDLKGKVFSTVKEAYHEALLQANSEDLIFVGGSTFVVADLLAEE